MSLPVSARTPESGATWPITMSCAAAKFATNPSIPANAIERVFLRMRFPAIANPGQHVLRRDLAGRDDLDNLHRVLALIAYDAPDYRRVWRNTSGHCDVRTAGYAALCVLAVPAQPDSATRVSLVLLSRLFDSAERAAVPFASSRAVDDQGRHPIPRSMLDAILPQRPVH